MSNEKKSFQINPIGFVRSPYKTRSSVDPWGGPAELHLFPEYAEGLESIERSSHLFVVGFLHEAARDVLKARPRRLDPLAPPIGVFACRAPVRPNPLSLTICQLLGRDHLVLRVEPLDLLDGTPLIDLKPYNPGWDDIFSARRTRRVQPPALTDEQLLGCLTRSLNSFLGDNAQAPAAQLALAAVYCAVRYFGLDPRDELLQVHTNLGGLTVDALLGLLGSVLSVGRVQWHNTASTSDPLFLFHAGGHGALVLNLAPAVIHGKFSLPPPEQMARLFVVSTGSVDYAELPLLTSELFA